MNEQQIIDIAQKVVQGALNIGDQLVTEVIRFMLLQSLMSCVAGFVCFTVCWVSLQRATKFVKDNPPSQAADKAVISGLLGVAKAGLIIIFTVYSVIVAKPTLKWLAAPHLALAEMVMDKKLELEKKP